MNLFLTTGFTIDPPKAQSDLAPWPASDCRMAPLLRDPMPMRHKTDGGVGALWKFNRAVGSSHPLNMRPDRGGAHPCKPDGPLDRYRK